MKKITLEIEGMSCIGCMNTVRNILLENPKIYDAEIELVPGKAVITAEDDFQVENAIKAIADKSQYRAIFVEEEPVIEY